ncbi:MAG: hypothetical protein JKX78_12625 [Alteromonadaceae bacterium]|nr:hypothetical protein [Alteromonadaceae bacterium]
MVDIHRICSKSPANCLPEINEQLQTTHQNSRVWYDLMQYKFESLFLLQDISELNKVTKSFVNKENLPIPFEISVNIYYAKSLSQEHTLNPIFIKQESKKFINKAKQLLALMNEAYPDPNLLIKLANIQMFIEEYQQAYQLLQTLAVNYKRYPDIVFHLDLYGNLGHLADILNYKKQAITYWLTSLKWAKELANEQQTATVYFNLANSQNTMQEFNNAQQNYLNAIQHAILAKDKIKRIEAQIALAQLWLTLDKKTQAKTLITNIDTVNLPQYVTKKLKQLKTKIKTK